MGTALLSQGPDVGLVVHVAGHDRVLPRMPAVDENKVGLKDGSLGGTGVVCLNNKNLHTYTLTVSLGVINISTKGFELLQCDQPCFQDDESRRHLVVL